MDKHNHSNEHINELSKRLGVVISLLLRMQPKDGNITLKEQVEILSDLSLRPTAIASILGRTPKYISKELSSINKKRRTK